MSQYASLVFFLLAVVAASALGAQFETGAWYQALSKPAWTPPDWLFGPAWAAIYLLMALAAWKVWNSRRNVRVAALAWWALILVLHVAWSWMMFGLNRTGWALGVSVILLGLTVMCCRAFFMVSRSAGAMMLPLAGWTIFVVCLNYTIWAMNQGGFGSLFG